MEVIMPQLGETVTEGTVAAWHKSVGDSVAADELLLDVETDKAATEVNAPVAGTLAEIRVAAGDTVEVGTVLAVIAAEGADAGPQRVASERAETAETVGVTARMDGNGEDDSKQRLSPVVRRLFREHGLSAADVHGTGRGGRITKQDVAAHLAQRADVEPEPAPAQPSATLRAGRSSAGHHPFNRVRRRTAEHMVRSKATSPHVLQATEVDFSAVDFVRRARRDTWRDEHGFGLTYLPFVARAVCSALGHFPHLNASVVDEGLTLHADVHLAIAVDLGTDGLVAPVIRSAQDLTVAGLARRIHDVSGRARNGKLKPDDLAGGTYTLSNSGTFGTLITAPIINQPQVAILSIDGVRKRPWVIESEQGDSLAIRPVGILAQSFDHRAVDGAYSAGFLAEVKRLLESSNWSDAF